MTANTCILKIAVSSKTIYSELPRQWPAGHSPQFWPPHPVPG